MKGKPTKELLAIFASFHGRTPSMLDILARPTIIEPYWQSNEDRNLQLAKAALKRARRRARNLRNHGKLIITDF